MNARDGMRRLRDERRNRGVCIYCGMKSPEFGRVKCRECIEQQKAYMKKYNERKKANG